MTDTLRDLLHESVAEADMPDVADLAWRAGGRARRRRAASAVAGVAALVLAVGGVAWSVDHRDGRRAAQPVQSPSPTEPAATTPPYDGAKRKPDGTYHGTDVWWAPSVAQESSLLYDHSPFPSVIDLSLPAAPLASHPIRRAIAAFVLVGDTDPSEVLVLAPDGSLRAVSLVPDGGSPAPVSPMRDPEGNLRIRAGASMLSPSGQYLMFPQDGSIRVLRLRDGRWSTIDTGSQATWDATWTEDGRIVLWDPARPGADAPVYDVSGRRVASAGATDDLVTRFDGDAYGLPRRSPRGALAQSYVAGADVPQPPALHLSPRQSDWIGVASGPDAILVLPQEPARQKQCCQVVGWIGQDAVLYESRSSEGLRLLSWLPGTRDFWQESEIVGWQPGQESVVTSYATVS